MDDDDSPYRSPATLDPQVTRRSSTSSSDFKILIFLGLSIVGGIAGFTGFIFAASILDTRDAATEPILSYGQQAGLISLPMCTLIGAAIGVGLAFALVREFATSVLLLLAVSLGGWAINSSFWNDQIQRHGPDPSEAVLYYPPLFCSGIALFMAAVVAVWAALARQKPVA